ncbi:MAG TPA: hypothetical protein VFS40_07130 [Gemmatimonadales bacterium]|nr:hypothetical protein [Gemmatimonadales bacterium]
MHSPSPRSFATTAVPAVAAAPDADTEIVAVLRPGPAEVRRARAILDAIDRDASIGAEQVIRRLRLPPAVVAALDPTGELGRTDPGYTVLVGVLLDTIAAGCTVQLVTHPGGAHVTAAGAPAR